MCNFKDSIKMDANTQAKVAAMKAKKNVKLNVRKSIFEYQQGMAKTETLSCESRYWWYQGDRADSSRRKDEGTQGLLTGCSEAKREKAKCQVKKESKASEAKALAAQGASCFEIKTSLAR